MSENSKNNTQKNSKDSSKDNFKEDSTGNSKSDANGKDSKPEVKDEVVIREHSITLNGKELRYRTETGYAVLREEDNKEEVKPKARIFYIAYTKLGTEDYSKRPLTFSFNGGPGSSSVWLHLGLLGPKRVIAEEDEQPAKPPYRLVDNEYSLLKSSDLVFIDPVSTGFSRSVEGEDPTEFHQFKKDLESVGDFIRLYTSRNSRWKSPKYLIGESYGTTRAAGLSGYLQNNLGFYLNGIMLISSVLNFQTIRFGTGNDEPHLLYLPTYAATARYHGKVKSESLSGLLKEVEEFCRNEYLGALFDGDDIDNELKESVLEKLNRFTSLSKTYLSRTHLRIDIHRFAKELLRDENRTVGRLDSRFKGIDRDGVDDMYSYDPSYPVIQGAYTATFNDYIREELGFESDLDYKILASLYQTWKFNEHNNQFVDVAETLRDSMSKNQNLRVFVGSGYYDMATPYFATNYTFNHMKLDESLRKNITMRFYEAGHMMYMHLPSLKQLSKDLDNFVS